MPDEPFQPFPITSGETKRVLEQMTAPIHKAGLVLLRHVQDEDPQVFLVQVKAKDPKDQQAVDFGLPKGTRRYLDHADNEWKDARDHFAAHEHRGTLESLDRTLMHEAEKEIGMPPAMFAKNTVRALGERIFQSRKGNHYEIGWYVMEANTPLVESLDPAPEEAHAVKWCPLSELRAMEAEGKINPDYVRVIEEAIGKFRDRTLPKAVFTGSLQQTI